MEKSHFKGKQTEKNAFYKIPKTLFTDERFKTLSLEAKILYAMFLDRMSLSKKNNWKDEHDRIYIIFTIENIMEAFGCANKKAGQLVAELEKVKLIEKKRQGLCKPSLIYVQDFTEEPFCKCEKNISENVKSTSLEMAKEHTSNLEYYPTENSKTENLIPSEDDDAIKSEEKVKSLFAQQIQMQELCKEYPEDSKLLENILDLIVEVMCSRKKFLRIAGDDKPTEFVQNRFRKLSKKHIRYVLDCLHQNTTEVRNIKTYLLTSIFNAPATMEGYYSTRLKKQKDSLQTPSFLEGSAIEWDKLQEKISSGIL